MSKGLASEYLPERPRDKLIAAAYNVPGDPNREMWIPLLCDGVEMQTQLLDDPIEIVEGLLTERMKFLIASSAKSFKTWLTLDLALSIAGGTPFLGRQTERESVLYVNLELKPDTLTRRLQAITKAKSLQLSVSYFTHLPLRGHIAGLPAKEIVSRLIATVHHTGAKVLVLDPLYKLNTGGDENSSSDMTALFNELDRITTEANCTLVLNDHFSKGLQSDKEALDAIRGSSAKAGDVDGAMTLKKHENDGCFRVDVIHRELPPVQPFVIGWAYPLMSLRPELDPEKMKRPGGRRREYAANEVWQLLEAAPLTTTEWQKRAVDELGISRRQFYTVRKELETGGRILLSKTNDKWTQVRKVQ